MAEEEVTSGPIDLLGLTSAATAALAAGRDGIGAERIHRLWRLAFREGRLDPAAVGFGPVRQQVLRELFRCEPPPVVRMASEAGGLGPTAKLVHRLSDGLEVESVAFPVGRSLALCISSQVGCRMGCTFCETGRMGLVRQLTAGEIVGQVLAAQLALGRRPDRVVFMGMGEALDNCDAVIAALAVLADRRGFGFAQERLTVCTSGRVDGLRRLRALGWRRLGIGVSLNAAEDALRDQLMPVNRRTPLATLQQALIDYRRDLPPNVVISVNYCLLPGINDGPDAPAAVARFCAPLGRCLVSLIPYNPGNRPIARSPTEAEVVDFIERLRAAGVAVRRRITKGRSIMAACGQLGNVALRRGAKNRGGREGRTGSGQAPRTASGGATG